jgi:hypothetical protein
MSNRLAQASSLYLRQHGNDPVDWYPWGDEALDAARRANKPIMLSIGYSACHWCHVMARESFADPAIAALLGASFIAIKVDREERPDLDRIYQLAHQALQRRGGGWPLTAFLEPHSLLPFFVGTYFPPERRHGLPAFAEVLRGLAHWYQAKPDELARHREALQAFFDEHAQTHAHQGVLDDAPLREAERRWFAQTDAAHGGTQGGPKFPHATELSMCTISDSAGLQEHAARSLIAMARGGLQDHLGGGFFRYCVDEAWEIPHFEKMLYDNALLLPEFARAASAGDPEMRAAAVGIVSWLQEEMALSAGGFAAALDADSEHEEGAYYLWQRDEFAALLPEEDRHWMLEYFGFERPANFEDKAWHITVRKPLSEYATPGTPAWNRLRELLKQARRRGRLARAQRPAPARDDKCLLGWNALLLAGLARAAKSMDRSDWIEPARKLASVLLQRFRRDGRWYAVAYADAVRQPAYLDDLAALALGLLDLLEARWETAWLESARDVVEAMLEGFEDREHGGFFFTAHDHEALPQRSKPWTDEATPSGNGLAIQALLRIGWLLGEPRYLIAAERALRAAWPSLQELPHGCASVLRGLSMWLRPTPVLIARMADQHEAERWRGVLTALHRDGAHVVQIPAGDALLPSPLVDKRWLAGGRVYWCEGTRCLPRFDSPIALEGHAQRSRR